MACSSWVFYSRSFQPQNWPAPPKGIGLLAISSVAAVIHLSEARWQNVLNIQASYATGIVCARNRAGARQPKHMVRAR